MPSLADALAKDGFTNAEKTHVTHWLDTGYPVLNHRVSGSYLNGGLPMGRIIEIFGPPSAGKTAIATACMVSAQQAGGFAMFQDHETSYDEGLGIENGLDTDPNKYLYRQPDTFEESVDEVVKVWELIRSGDFGIDKDAPIVCVFDSLASMIPKSKWDKDASDFNMNDNTALARATSAAFPTLSKKASQLNVCVIFLNQARTKIGVMFGDPTTTPGGNAPEFYASVRLKLGGSKMKDDKGKTVGCQAVKNKVYRPFLKCEWDFVFQDDGSGKFDAIGGVLEELKALGRIDMKGNKYIWEGKEYFKTVLTAKIEKDGTKDKLYAMLPKDDE